MLPGCESPPIPSRGILPSNLKLSKVNALKGKHFARHFLKLGDTEDCVWLMSGKTKVDYRLGSDIWELSSYCFLTGECCCLWDWPELLKSAGQVMCEYCPRIWHGQAGERLFCYYRDVVMHPANMSIWRYEDTLAKIGCGCHVRCLSRDKMLEKPIGIRKSKESGVQQQRPSTSPQKYATNSEL